MTQWKQNFWFYCKSAPRLIFEKTHRFQSLMVKSCENFVVSQGQRSLITMNIWFSFFFQKDAVICQISLYCSSSCHLYSNPSLLLLLPSSPHCLWVSDSSSLPVTARCLDFELALFTPLSVVVVVICRRFYDRFVVVMLSCGWAWIAAFKKTWILGFLVIFREEVLS